METTIKSYNRQTDAQIIKENGLTNNNEKFVNDFVQKMKEVSKEVSKELPQDWKTMLENKKQFKIAYDFTNQMNGGISKLFYLVSYLKEHGSDFSIAMGLPDDFLKLYAKHFIAKR